MRKRRKKKNSNLNNFVIYTLSILSAGFFLICYLNIKNQCVKLNNDIINDYVKLPDQESFQMARRIIKEEGLLVGGSSGGAVWAALQKAKKLKKGEKCLAILPDSIRNYLSKFVDDKWMEENNFI